jgi:hypothetical protein
MLTCPANWSKDGHSRAGCRGRRGLPAPGTAAPTRGLNAPGTAHSRAPWAAGCRGESGEEGSRAPDLPCIVACRKAGTPGCHGKRPVRAVSLSLAESAGQPSSRGFPVSALACLRTAWIRPVAVGWGQLVPASLAPGYVQARAPADPPQRCSSPPDRRAGTLATVVRAALTWMISAGTGRRTDTSVRAHRGSSTMR